ncbi:MAG: sigma-70 family RNA polymerase sigma factor [Acidobacteriota bacterium]
MPRDDPAHDPQDDLAAAFHEACETAAVEADVRSRLWQLLVDVPPGRQANAERLEWLLADHGHWRLFRAALDGDDEAAAEFENYWRRYVTAFLGPRMDGRELDELIALFFERVHERVPRLFQWQSPFRSYLRQVLLNVWRNDMDRQRRRREREVGIESLTPGGWETSTRRESSPERQLEAKETASRVNAALAELPPVDRHLLVACLGHGESRQELADRMGLSPDALYQRLSRAKRKMKSILERDGTDE